MANVLPLIHGYQPSMELASRLNIVEDPKGSRYTLQSSEHYKFVIITRYSQIIGFNSVSEIRKQFGFGWIKNEFIKFIGRSKS